MIYCVGKFETGESSYTDETTGKEIKYNNVKLYVVTDEVPEKNNDGSTLLCVKELKIAVADNPKKIGFSEWNAIVGKYLEIGYSIVSNKINRIRIIKKEEADYENAEAKKIFNPA